MLIGVMQSYLMGAMSVSAPKERVQASAFRPEWTVGWPVNVLRPAHCWVGG